jgi:predicted permease
MRWVRQLTMRTRMLFRRGKERVRLDDELQFHLDGQIAENRAAGMSDVEARRAALRSFGNPALLRDQSQATWSWAWLESLLLDLRFAWRSLRRSPGFSASVIGTLGLGIGAAAAMFTVVDHVLLRPLPYRDGDRLVQLHESDGAGKGVWDAPWLDIEEWIERNRSFESIAFAGSLGGHTYLEGKPDVLPVQVVTASPNLFQVLGAAPALGRGFEPGPPSFAVGRDASSLVLSYPVWQTAFGSDPAVVGKTAHINGKPYTVIGVMPRGFFYPKSAPDAWQVWLPVQLSEHDKERSYLSANYAVIARLRPETTVQSAQAEMAVMQKTIAAEYKDEELRTDHATAKVERFSDTLVDADVKKALLALAAASGVLWLIASVNATNLMLARGTARQREIAVRGALGASRRHVVQQMIVEGLVLSAVAAAMGIGLALAGIAIAAKTAPARLGVDLSAHVSLNVLAALCGLTLLSALMASSWPALIAARAPIEPALRQGGAQAGTNKRQHLLRGSLVAAEIAMSLTLLVVCGLLLRTIYTLHHVPLGYRTDHILVANLNIPSYRYTGQNLAQALYMPLLDRVQHLHGVEAAGLMSEAPLDKTFHIQFALRMNGNLVSAELKPVTPDIQRIFAFRMLAGRYFNPLDTPTSQPVAVVNPAFAKLYTPNKHDPSAVIGTKLWNLRPNAPAIIVGVMDDTKQMSVAEATEPEINICLCQITPDSGIYQPTTVSMDLALRTARPPETMIPTLRDILRNASPELATARFTTMDQIVEDSFGSQRMAAHLLEIFGGSAMLLCLAGLYGLLAYVVAQRTRELGVRVALGARRGNLMWLVMRQAGAMLVVGVAIGTALALASGRLVRGYLYGVGEHDGWTLASAAVLLLVSGLAAAYIPARRAARVDPMVALRSE